MECLCVQIARAGTEMMPGMLRIGIPELPESLKDLVEVFAK